MMGEKSIANPRYYNWLLYSVAASFLLFGGFALGKEGGMPLVLAMLIRWGLSGILGGVFWSLVIAGIARIMKRNYKNAFLGSFAIFLFLFACITVIQVYQRLG